MLKQFLSFALALTLALAESSLRLCRLLWGSEHFDYLFAARDKTRKLSSESLKTNKTLLVLTRNKNYCALVYCY